MGMEQFNNMLTLAAALSMAGWVARTPDYLPDHQQFDNNEEIDFFGLQQQFWQNNDYEDILAPLVQTMPANYDINDNFHDSKLMTDFTPFSEVQELLSWQEAYRRGDLSFGGTNYAFPYTYEGNNEHLFTELQNPHDNYGIPYTPSYDTDNGNLLSQLPSYYDDGYGSGDTNIGSPDSSDMSLFSLNLDDMSASSSPPNLFDLNDTVGVEDLNSDLANETLGGGITNDTEIDVPGAVGYSIPDPDFDIEQLFNDDYYDLHDALPRMKDEPPETVRSRVSDLDYASPLIDPNFDDYLGRFIAPNQQNILDTSLDDPFRMQFTEQAIPDGKYISDVLSEFDSLPYSNALNGDFPTPYEKTLDSEGGEEEVETLSAMQGASQNSYSGPPAENIHSPKSITHLPDHDYAKRFDDDELMDPGTRKAVDALASNFVKYHKDTVEEEKVKIPSQTRTYAPSRRSAASSSPKRPKEKSIVYPDFPYTADELIDMDVDHFNTLVAKLDDIRQLVLRDLRKRGKNKHAARNCRKRKLEIIDDLDNNVELLEKQKELLLKEQQLLLEETRQIHEKTVWLNNYILERLYDENGNSYADSDYTLEYTTDGNVYLVPYVMKKQGKTAS